MKKCNTIYGIKYSHIALAFMLLITLCMCALCMAVVERSDQCTPYCENKYWIGHIRDLANNRKAITKEVKKAMKTDMWTRWAEYDKLNETPTFTKMSHNELVAKLSEDRCRLDEGKRSWKIFGLVLNGKPIDDTYKVCPKLVDRLLKIPVIINAGFSCFEPGVSIPEHRGYNNKILRCHIPLIIPEGDTGIQVAYKRMQFSIIKQASGYFIFNDTCMHRAWNNTDKKRIVLIIDLKK